MMGPTIQLSRNFRSSEFSCPCCGLFIHNTGLVQLLQALRDAAGEIVSINSGVRCQRHNARVGGAALSSHLNGSAADFVIGSSSSRWTNTKSGGLLKSLDEQKKIWVSYSYLIQGQSGTAVHVDVDRNKKRNSRFAY